MRSPDPQRSLRQMARLPPARCATRCRAEGDTSGVGRRSPATRGLARAAQGMEEQGRYYGALRQSDDPALARRALALALTDELPSSMAAGLVGGVAGRHPALAWDFAREHADALLAKVTFFERNGYFPHIARAFHDRARADELLAFVAQKLPPEARVEAEKAADDIRFKAALKARLLPKVDAWIAARK